jgi:integrase
MPNSNRVSLKTEPFENRGGSISYRVTGSLYGKRVQKNFPTREQAERKMNELKRSADQGDSVPLRSVQTTLQSDRDLKEAEFAWERLRKSHPTGSLLTAVDHYLAHAGVLVKDEDMGAVISRYIDHRRALGNRANTLVVAESLMRKFAVEQGVGRASDFTQAKAEAFILDMKVEARTRRDRRDALNYLAGYMVGHGHLSRNPVEAIGRPRVTRDGEVSMLSVEQVLSLLKAAATEHVGRWEVPGAMLAYFAVCSLSGVRPDEARRLGPDWRWYSRENAVITGFRAKNPAKTRTVELTPQLIGILDHCRQMGYAPSMFSDTAFDEIRRKAGVLKLWDNDILRHTYASNHYACLRDMNWLEKNMGNSAGVLKQSYLNQTVTAETGRELLAITLGNIISDSDRARIAADPRRPDAIHIGAVTTLSAEQVLALLRVAAAEPVGRRRVRGAMLAYFATCALGGLRPMEARRLGAGWEWLADDGSTITVAGAGRKSTSRSIQIHPGLAAILLYCRGKGFPPSDYFEKGFDHIREKAGILDSWDNDILLRTFASHHFAWKRDARWLEENLGVSAYTLESDYLDKNIGEAAGRALFSIELNSILAPPNGLAEVRMN